MHCAGADMGESKGRVIMVIEYVDRDLGVSALMVDGEDVELMTPKKREWVLNRVMERIDQRYLECVLESIVHMYGEVDVTEDGEGTVYRTEL